MPEYNIDYCANLGVMSSNNPEWLDWFGIILGSGLLTALFAGAIASKSGPITRKGAFCPIGYYRTSAYCLPLKATTPPAVPRTTKNCPIGTYTQTDYCLFLERAK